MIFKIHPCFSAGFLEVLCKKLKAINILIIFSIISACASPFSPAPVATRHQPPSTKVLSHVVAPGETLYSIAWRYGLNYKKLAKNNEIASPYGIFPGQIIHLAQVIKPVSKPSSAVLPKAVAGSKGSDNTRFVGKKNSSAVVVNKPLNGSVSSLRSEKKSRLSSRSVPTQVNKGKIDWQWPAGGRVLTNFYAKRAMKKGIDIEGKKGESIIAAAAGEVVYAGSGLRAYGKLIIIKHNDVYLSAYAHSDRLRVKEGQSVNAGQRIADIGSTGTGAQGKSKLHFQIRRNGKPINPLSLLPSRK